MALTDIAVGDGEIYYDVAVFVFVTTCYVALESWFC